MATALVWWILVVLKLLVTFSNKADDADEVTEEEADIFYGIRLNSIHSPVRISLFPSKFHSNNYAN